MSKVFASAVLLAWCAVQGALGATITLSTNVLGSTPRLLAYNSGHFLTNSNTRDWWRYAGVSGARVFLSPSEIEPSDDVPPVGDGVDSPATFLTRKAALRADPLNLSYINWANSSCFSNRYESNDLYPNNHIRPNYTFREMRKLGISICVQITGSQSRFPISGTNDWPNMWEFWQHYYAQAFYLARTFDVERYQMFNEPNHPNANGLTQTNFLLRLQLASDAIQCAIADVNKLDGRTLSPNVLAPVTSGSADGSYAGWGQIVVTNLHRTFLNQIDPGFNLVHTYDYHQYGSSPAAFGSDLANLHGYLTSDTSPGPRLLTACSEFNTDTGATFDTLTETLDSPTKYPRFGAICVNMLANGLSEFYAFKFSQTESSAGATYPVQKNAMHYVDNLSSPYNVGGITKAGEVYRLFNKAFAPGRHRVGSSKDSGAASLDVHAAYDPVRQRYFVFSVNNTATDVALTFSFPNVPAAVGNRVYLEEVSETCFGSGRVLTNVPAGRVFSAGTQRAYTVWLLTIPARVQDAEQVLQASDDAEVRDGSNRLANYGASPSLTIRNDPANVANRSAGLIRFDLAGIALTNIETAFLVMNAATTFTNIPVQAHVYGLVSNSWSEGNLTWATAPNLKQNLAAGNVITNQCVSGVGDSAFILGQLAASSTNSSEKWIDVTEWLRTRTNGAASFLITQDPRWNVALPSLDTGDTQPDGIKIISGEGGNGPRLLVTLRAGAPTNTPPAARDDSASTLQSFPVTIPVLENDTDADGGTLAISGVSLPANGSAATSNNGTITYSPQGSFVGVDHFSYTITDGQGGSSTAQVSVAVNPVSSPPYWTNLPVSGEAFVRGGASAALDQDEETTGFLFVKYNAAPYDLARKAYFQFDVSGLQVNSATQALFTVGFLNSYKQNVQLWALNQAYPAFSPVMTWNTAQANELSGNGLLTEGTFTATSIGAVTNLPASGTTPFTFAIPMIGNYLRDGRLTLALSGAPDTGGYTNNQSGLRLLRTNATLQLLVAAPAGTVPPPPVITAVSANEDGTIALSFAGATNRIHWIQATTNLLAQEWETISTNVSDAQGLWSYTDLGATNWPQRFYRAVVP